MRSLRAALRNLGREITTPSRVVDPAGIAPTAANYAHARVVQAGGTRTLYTSGILPIAPDGTVPEALEDQAETVWGNVLAILHEANMAPSAVVSVTTYVTPGTDLGVVMAARDRALGGHMAASTLVVVHSLARPEWLFEVAVVAAA